MPGYTQGISNIIFLGLFFLTASTANSQFLRDWKPDFGLGSGVFTPHKSDMNFDRDLFLWLDVGLSKNSDGTKVWQTDNFLPRYGVRYIYFHLPDPAMGRGHSVWPWVGNDFLTRNKWRCYYQVGFGLGYLTKVYDPVENPRQDAISSHVNVYFDFRTGFAYHLNENRELALGLTFFHFSNAGTKFPNSGMNFLGLHLGYNQKHTKPGTSVTRSGPYQKYEVLLGFNGSARQYLVDRPYDFLANSYVEVNRRMAPNYRLGLGLNIFYEAHEKVYERWANYWGDGTHQSYRWNELLTGGLYINNEWVFQRFSAFLHIGAYFYGHYREMTSSIVYVPEDGPFIHRMTFNQAYIFNRLGFRYRMTDKLMLNLSMLTHMAKARYTELGIAWRL